MTDIALAVDLGGTNVRCSVIDSGGAMLFDSQQTSGADEGVDAVIRRIAKMIETAAEDQGLSRDVTVGVVAPGPLDPVRGIVRHAPNLKGWSDVPLRDRLRELTGRQVLLGNDANSQALGEYYFGAAADIDNLVYVALGTGLGGGVIAEGKLIDGIDGLGGELGHTTVDMDGPRCSCGSRGCVEAYCSGWALARDGQALAESKRSPYLSRIAGRRPVSARDVSDAADEGDAAAALVISQAGRALGAGLANFTNIFNPEMIVIGGGLAEIGERLLAPARDALAEYALPALIDDLDVRRSALGVQTGLFGAAALVFHAGEK